MKRSGCESGSKETRYRFDPAPGGRTLQQQAFVRDDQGRDLRELTFAPQAELWRVNQRAAFLE
jgi:hypothetical protein